MADTSLHYWNDKMAKSLPRQMSLQYRITGTEACSPLVLSQPALFGWSDAAFTQPIIDNFLGTTNEFLVAAFDATAMDADTFALIVNMKGQVAKLLSVEALVYSGSQGATYAPQAIKTTSLTASTNATEAALGANGNVAVRVISSGIDLLTSGLIVVNFYWVAK